MAVYLQIGYLIIIITVAAALITGRREPIFWGLLFFVGASALAFAGIFSAKKATKEIMGDLEQEKEK